MPRKKEFRKTFTNRRRTRKICSFLTVTAKEHNRGSRFAFVKNACCDENIIIKVNGKRHAFQVFACRPNGIRKTGKMKSVFRTR
ncbi:MAG: hypothetical protein L6V93_09280 [Clostridiales bacterium]|nr:MAG: hypothetical protein L6V93_09280 [Clostridiales bacterium]